METGNNVVQNLISIIVPIYNGEAYLDRCVQSIRKQTYTEWELILVDGASVDKTPYLCEKWQQCDKRIRVIHSSENKGVSESRNWGIRSARGSYLMFVDADDWLRPDCLQRLYEDIQQDGVQIAGCSFLRCTEEDWIKQETGMTQRIKEQQDKRLIAGKDFLQEGILKQDTRCWSKLYQRELVEGHFFREDFTIGEDMLFLWEVAKEAELISSSAYPGYCYYYNVNGAMLKPFRDSDMDQIRCWQLVLEQLCAVNGQASAKGDREVYDKSVISKTATILMISCMLVVGKLSGLPGKERKQYSHLQEQCSHVLKEAMQIEGAYDGLDKGYRLKVRLYTKLPGFYISLYHMRKLCFGR